VIFKSGGYARIKLLIVLNNINIPHQGKLSMVLVRNIAVCLGITAGTVVQGRFRGGFCGGLLSAVSGAVSYKYVDYGNKRVCFFMINRLVGELSKRCFRPFDGFWVLLLRAVIFVSIILGRVIPNVSCF